MPSLGAIAGGLIGGVIGFVVTGFNPVGALYGASIGMGVGGYLDPETIPGPGLPDAQVQSSQDNIPIPIIWGRYQVMGNIIQVLEPYEVTTTERTGKGSSSEVESTRRYQTFAIGVCEGPINGITRIWQNDKLVFDARTAATTPPEESGNTAFTTSIIDPDDHTKFAGQITIYLGGEDQLPDPELESATGVGNQLAYRGLAYVVFKDIDITDFASAIPQYKFEVNGSFDNSVTSKPYPIDVLDGLQVGFNPDDPMPETNYQEGVDVSFTPQDGTLDEPLKSTDYDTEGLDTTFTPQDGTLDTRLESTDYDTEGLAVSFTPQDGTLEVQLVQHQYEDEGLDVTFTPKDGTLT